MRLLLLLLIGLAGCQTETKAKPLGVSVGDCVAMSDVACVVAGNCRGDRWLPENRLSGAPWWHRIEEIGKTSVRTTVFGAGRQSQDYIRAYDFLGENPVYVKIPCPSAP